jgi:hypothetical protein
MKELTWHQITNYKPAAWPGRRCAAFRNSAGVPRCTRRAQTASGYCEEHAPTGKPLAPQPSLQVALPNVRRHNPYLEVSL